MAGWNFDPSSGTIESAPRDPTGAPIIDVHPLPRTPEREQTKRDRVVEFWVGKGAPRHVAEGIADRVGIESGFDPTVPGDSGTSVGLYQHHAERMARLKERPNWQDPQVQNEFAYAEVTGGDPTASKHWQEILKAPDRNTAERLWTEYFERPKATGKGESADRTQAGGWQFHTTAVPGKWQASDNALAYERARPDTQLRYMSPADYLALVPPPEDTPANARKRQILQASLDRGEPIEAVPGLDVKPGANGALSVYDQDGRHRAMAAQAAGVDLMPVAIRGVPQDAEFATIRGMTGKTQPYDFRPVPPMASAEAAAQRIAESRFGPSAPPVPPAMRSNPSPPNAPAPIDLAPRGPAPPAAVPASGPAPAAAGYPAAPALAAPAPAAAPPPASAGLGQPGIGSTVSLADAAIPPAPQRNMLEAALSALNPIGTARAEGWSFPPPPSGVPGGAPAAAPPGRWTFAPPADPAPSAPSPPGFIEREGARLKELALTPLYVGAGAARPVLGGDQLLAHLAQSIGVPGGETAANLSDSAVRGLEGFIAQGSPTQQDQAMAGDIGAGFLMPGARAVNALRGIAPRIAAQAGLGAAYGAAQPVADPEGYGHKKTVQTALGTGLGATLGGAGEALAGGVNMLARAVSPKTLTSAATRLFGADTDKITPQIMNAARERIGATFERIENDHDIPFDKTLADDLGNVILRASDLLGETDAKPILAAVKGVLDRVDGGVIPAKSAATTWHRGSRLDNLTDSKNPDVAALAQQTQRAVRGALDRSLPPDDAAVYRAARNQWRDFKLVEKTLLPGEDRLRPRAFVGKVATRFPSEPSMVNPPAVVKLARAAGETWPVGGGRTYGVPEIAGALLGHHMLPVFGAYPGFSVGHYVASRLANLRIASPNALAALRPGSPPAAVNALRQIGSYGSAFSAVPAMAAGGPL